MSSSGMVLKSAQKEQNEHEIPQMTVAPGKSLAIPAVEDPALYCRTHLNTGYGVDNAQELKFAKGTTTLAFIYDGGIVVAVDSRSTQGPFIASQTVDKVNEITSYLLATIAGGAADCQFWQRNLTIQCRMYELRNGHKISVTAASKLIANTCRHYSRYGMSMGMMMIGFEGKNDEIPTLYYVDDTGSRLKASDMNEGGLPLFSVGSGSTYAYGVLDNFWRKDLSDDDAIELGARAIYHATYRDAYSGGMCNVFHFKPNGQGYTKMIHKDVLELHDLFEGGKNVNKGVLKPFYLNKD